MRVASPNTRRRWRLNALTEEMRSSRGDESPGDSLCCDTLDNLIVEGGSSVEEVLELSAGPLEVGAVVAQELTGQSSPRYKTPKRRQGSLGRKSDTTSKWMALVTRQMKTQTYPLYDLCPHPFVVLSWKGPA